MEIKTPNLKLKHNPMLRPQQIEEIKISCVMLAVSSGLIVFGAVESLLYVFILGCIAIIPCIIWLGSIKDDNIEVKKH